MHKAVRKSLGPWAYLRRAASSILGHLMVSHLAVLAAYVIITLSVSILLSNAVVSRHSLRDLVDQAQRLADTTVPEMAELQAQGTEAESPLPQAARADLTSRLRENVQRWARLLNVVAWVVNPKGIILVEPLRISSQPEMTRQGTSRDPLLDQRISPEELALLGTRQAQAIPETVLQRAVSGAYAPIFSDGQFLGAVFVYRSEAGFFRVQRGTQRALYTGAAVALLFALVVAYSSSRRLSLPLRHMRNAAIRMADGDFDAHVAEQGATEINELGTSLNTLNERLDFASTHYGHSKNCLLHSLTAWPKV